MKILCSLRTLVTTVSAAFAIGILAGMTLSAQAAEAPSTSDVLDHRIAEAR
ncbi:hypothetical protein [Actinokineospora pegani]|uniref:hypothetical protein n=1 Tax=Actinokineospora pegani TaxID=2654637 RepID=UPI0012EACE7E|nr:hypothetical protein [Actinokineospora pegani]